MFYMIINQNQNLLNKSEATGIKFMTLRLLEIEVYKYVNNLNPRYLNKIFTMKKCPYHFLYTYIPEDIIHIPQNTALNPLEIMLPKYGIF